MAPHPPTRLNVARGACELLDEPSAPSGHAEGHVGRPPSDRVRSTLAGGGGPLADRVLSCLCGESMNCLAVEVDRPRPPMQQRDGAWSSEAWTCSVATSTTCTGAHAPHLVARIARPRRRVPATRRSSRFAVAPVPSARRPYRVVFAAERPRPSSGTRSQLWDASKIYEGSPFGLLRSPNGSLREARPRVAGVGARPCAGSLQGRGSVGRAPRRGCRSLRLRSRT
jgi:hypothetical protein